MIFTEIGVRSLVGATLEPGNWRTLGLVDLVDQKRWYQAALQTFAPSWMKGLFIWAWSPYLTDGGPNSTNYSPHGKPAEAVLHYWFTRKLR